MIHSTFSLYDNYIELDEKTQKPKDYDMLFASYRPLVLAAAARVYIPESDRAEAVQEVQLKFWQKDAMKLFDPSRGIKFGTFYRKWTSMFLLQERDKSIRRQRYLLVDNNELLNEGGTYAPSNTVESVENDYVRADSIKNWVAGATQALQDGGYAHLVPLLELCLETAEDKGKAPSRAEIVDATGIKINKSTAMIKELRSTLTELGYGMETLYAT